MPATTVKSARKNLKSLVRDVTSDTVAVEIVGEQDNAVLISLARYTALREATFLLRSPELMESLRREAARSLMPPALGDDAVDTVVHDTVADASAADRTAASLKKPEPTKPRTRKKRRKKRSRRH